MVTVTHNAYGWSGPWQDRRGFDSLVQMSSGIAELGMVSAGVDRPFPMPVQALDHGVGWLLAAGACRALTQWIETGRPSDVRGSLIGAANVLMSRPTPNGLGLDRPVWSETDRVDGQSQWGPLRRAPLPSQVEGLTPRWTVEAGELGRHRAEWLTGV
jgi:crotonobetainyl-CoA:carnitine CoA-transferase CaiB-like acyl-CoA transferase